MGVRAEWLRSYWNVAAEGGNGRASRMTRLLLKLTEKGKRHLMQSSTSHEQQVHFAQSMRQLGTITSAAGPDPRAIWCNEREPAGVAAHTIDSASQAGVLFWTHGSDIVSAARLS